MNNNNSKSRIGYAPSTKSGSCKMGYTPIKAHNPLPKDEPKSSILKTGRDLRVKAGK